MIIMSTTEDGQVESAVERIDSNLNNVMTDEDIDDIRADLQAIREEGVDISMFTSQLSKEVAMELDSEAVIQLYNTLADGSIESVQFVDQGRIGLVVAGPDAVEMSGETEVRLSFRHKL